MTDVRCLNKLLLGAKLSQMAKLRGTNIPGLFIRALFLTAQESLAENSKADQLAKYEKLTGLLASCCKLQVRLYVDEK